MDTVTQMVTTMGRLVRSRLFGVTALAVVSAAMVTYVSCNMHAVTVIDGEESCVVLTLNHDADAILQEARIAVGADDEIISELDFRSGEIEINRAFDVQVTADGCTTVVRMTGGTVADALQKVGVSIGENDVTSVHTAETVSEGLNICINRVAYGETVVNEAIPYESSVEYTNELDKGKTEVKQAGREGVRTYTYRDTMVDGEKTGTELVSEEVTLQPVSEIKLVGTRTAKAVSSVQQDGVVLDANGVPANYKAVYTGRATAYTNDRGLAGHYTASGRRAEVGVVAVNPNIIPYGTRLYIASPDGKYVYGYAVAGDTGGALMSGHAVVDLFMATYEECVRFGARTMNVYVLN
ncbi:MAG: DUF348 domain-containing protein [Clostridiales bacterium]|nr:DUF348 domain-containing protein [Clostridiales bacterium]